MSFLSATFGKYLVPLLQAIPIINDNNDNVQIKIAINALQQHKTPEAVWADTDYRRHSLVYHFLCIVQLTFIMFLIDKVVLQLILRKHKEKGRWFYAHALGNLIVTFYALPGVITFFQDPIHHLLHVNRELETVHAVSVLHIYHLLFYTCSADDIFHHIAFAGGGVFTNILVHWPLSSQIYLICITGLPGFGDYLMLALREDGYVTRESRLKLAVWLNMWVRSPGIVMSWSFGIIWFVYAEKSISHIIGFALVTFASVGNSQYYATQVVLAAGATFGEGNKKAKIAPPSSPVQTIASPTFSSPGAKESSASFDDKKNK